TAIKGSIQVEVDHGLPTVGSQLFRFCWKLPSGVSDKHVDFSIFRYNLVDGLEDRIRIAHIQELPIGIDAHVAKPVCRWFKMISISRCYYYLGSGLSNTTSHLKADAGASSGNNRILSLHKIWP